MTRSEGFVFFACQQLPQKHVKLMSTRCPMDKLQTRSGAPCMRDPFCSFTHTLSLQGP